jgi:aspartyl protease family protein
MIRFILSILAFAFAVGMASRQTPKEAPAPLVAAAGVSAPAETAKAPVIGNGFAETELARDEDGHFYADLMVNGAPIHFLVDTGATTVALTREDAQKAGLHFSEEEFTGTALTANGKVGLKRVILDRMALGPLEATQVEGAIIQQGLSQSLLGQSWLRHVGKVTIEGDKMLLR